MLKKFNEFCFLPYLKISQAFKIQNVEFCSLQKDFLLKINDENLKKSIINWASVYCDGMGGTIDDFTAVYIETPLRLLSDIEKRRILNAVHCLTYISMSRSLRLNFINLENFTLNSVRLPENDNDEFFTVNGNGKIIGGLQFGKNKIFAPIHLMSERFRLNETDKELLLALGACIDYSESSSKGKETYSRILRAVDWFNLAHSNNDTDKRILMLGVAFETLLNTPEENITKYFANAIEMLTGPDPEISLWAKNFYKLRSMTIHGSIVKEDDFLYGKDKHTTHFELSRVIFDECLRVRLQLLNLVQIPQLTKAIRFQRIQLMLISNKERFRRIKEISGNSNLKEDWQMQNELYDAMTSININDLSHDKQQCEEVKGIVKDLKKKDFLSPSTLNTTIRELDELIIDLEMKE